MKGYNMLKSDVIKLDIFNTLELISREIANFVEELNSSQDRVPIDCEISCWISKYVVNFSVFKLKSLNLQD